jgi:hypothetical protein
MQSRTVSGLKVEYDKTKLYLEGSVLTPTGPKSTLWSHEGMNLEYPEWDLLSYRKKEEELRDALTHTKPE